MKYTLLQTWCEFSLDCNSIHKFELNETLACYFANVTNELWVASKKISYDNHNASISSAEWIPSTQRELAKDTLRDEAQQRAINTIINFDPDLNWSRWALNHDTIRIVLTPVFPNLPVVVKPEYQFKLLPEGSANIYVRIPIWIQIKSISNSSLKITEIPSSALSRTWFGSFLEGELCYWFKTTARRVLDDDIFKPHLCVCPIKIINSSDEELQIDKLCLRTEQLSIFINQKSLWSDQMIIEYKGSNNFSDIMVSGAVPKEAKDARLISPPKNPAKKGLARRTFRLLNELQAKIG